MLERIKKRQYEGFKEFVTNLETTNFKQRLNIVYLGILEDPIYMTHVLKNLKSFEDILQLPTFELEKVMTSQEQVIILFAKALVGSSDASLLRLKNLIPAYFTKISDELDYFQGITSSEVEGARLHLIKIIRKLQFDDEIQAFPWRLPTQEVFLIKTPKEGINQIFFENGVLAAEGKIFKAKREGDWKHFYETGKLFAMGEYSDGLKSGSWIYYYGDGSIRFNGSYQNDLKQGVWFEYEKNGIVIEAHYKDNVKIS